jgi:hypothetical protein
MPEDTYSRRLNLANIIVFICNVAVPAIAWIYDIKEEYTVADVAFDLEQLSLILSCLVLAWGIRRLVRLVQFDSDLLAKKAMII